MRKSPFIVLTAAAVVGVAVGIPSASAANRHVDPPCTISPSPAAVGQTYVVSVSGLPTGTAINLWVTAPDGTTTGSPLGSTPDGTFALNESSSSAGQWTYAFSGPTKQHTVVYSTCSVTAS
jgi:hypothetical protein